MTATYDCIATTTVSGSSVADITFTGISGNYTDLLIIAQLKVVTSATNTWVRVGNGSIDTGANYSWTRMLGNGSTVLSSRGTNVNDGAIIGDAVTTQFTADIIHIQNYANTTTNKTILTRNSEGGSVVQAAVGLWRSTSAINQVRIYATSRNLDIGSSVTIYGIKAE